MVELRPDRVEKCPGQPRVPEVLVKKGALPDQEEHRQAAEEVEGEETLFDGRQDSGLSGH
jgi:hypothetical protein